MSDRPSSKAAIESPGWSDASASKGLGSAAGFSHLWAIGANTFREAIRSRVLYAVGIYGLVLLAAMLALPRIAGGAQFKMLLDVGLAAMEAIAVAIALVAASNAIDREIDKRTILVALSKPIARAEFVLGKVCGLAAVLAVAVAAMLALFAVALWVQQNDLGLELAVLSAGFLWLRLVLVVAIAIGFGTFSSGLLALLLSLTLYLIGNLSQDLIRIGKATENADLERLTRMLYLVLPDFSRLDIKNDAIYGFAGLPDAATLVGNVAYGIFYTALVLAIATGIFSRRQF